MKTRKLFFSLITAVFTIALVSSAALAGSKQRHRWEGVAIGVGAAILGHAILQTYKPAHLPRPVYANPEPPVRYHHGPKHRHGYWTWQKIWVPPTYNKVWNPGHYNRKGRWVKGHWVQLTSRDGYWTQERVWISRNHAPR